MGCWNYRIFCDDVAMDALDELLNSRDYLKELEEYLNRVLTETEDMIPYDTCQYGLVAAALVDVIQNGVNWDLLTDVLMETDDVCSRMVEKMGTLNAWFLCEKAIRVIEAVEGENSELREMWEENQDAYPRWRENLDVIRERIRNNHNLPDEVKTIYMEKKMRDEDFFRMTDMLDWDQEGNDDLVLEPLIAYLAKWPDEVITAFDDRMAKLLYDLDSRKRAKRIYGTDEHFSGDDFLYIRCVALVNGADFYEQVLNGERELSSHIEFEAILYVPAKAWARKYGKEPDAYPYVTDVSYETGSNRENWR